MSPKSIKFYSMKMSLWEFKIEQSHLFHGPIDMGPLTPLDTQFLPEIILKRQVFPPQNYTRGVFPISIGFRGINA